MAKHETDGHVAAINEDTHLQEGTILRRIGKDGSQSPFSDMVVTRIESVDTRYPSLKAARAFNQGDFNDFQDSHIIIHLARPYLYVTETGNCLMGYEKFSVAASSAIKNYSVVEMSTGKPAKYGPE